MTTTTGRNHPTNNLWNIKKIFLDEMIPTLSFKVLSANEVEEWGAFSTTEAGPREFKLNLMKMGIQWRILSKVMTSS